MAFGRPKISKGPAWVVLAFCLTALFAGSPAWGQKPSTSPDTTATAHAGPGGEQPSAIRIDNIPNEADERLDRLRMLRRDVQNDPVMPPAREQLSVLSRTIAELSRNTAALDLDRLSLQSLEEIQVDWSRLYSRITSLRRRLSEREDELEKQRAELTAESKRWRETKSSMTQADFPASLADRVDAVLEEIGKTNTLLSDHIRQVSELRIQVFDRESMTDRSYQEVQAALERARSRLFTSQEPPIWKLTGQRTGEPSVQTGLKQSIRWMRAAYAQFTHQYRHRMIGHLVFFILLTAAIYFFRERARRWDLDESTGRMVNQIARWPIPSAFLTTFALTRIIYPGVPVVVMDTIAILAVPMLLVLVPAVLPRSLLRPTYCLFVFIIAGRIENMIVAAGILGRAFQLTLTLGAFVTAAFWARRIGPSSHFASETARSAARAVARLAAFLLAVSAVANVFGAISVAEILTTGTLATGYVAVVVVVAARLLHALGHAVIGSPLARRLASVREHNAILKRRWGAVLNVLAVLFFTLGMLRWFGILGPVSTTLSRLLNRSWSVGSISVTIGAILAFFIAVGVSILVSRLVRAVLEGDVLPRTRVGRGTSATVSLLIHYAIVALGFVVALAAAGIQLSQLAIVFGALGIGIGFGLQTVVNNFISGLILIFERPIKVGDTIEVGTLLGTVQRIGIRASTVRTFAGAEVIVPNGNLLADQVVNWTLSDVFRRIDIPIGVAYGTDPSTVVKLLVDVAKTDKRVLARPEPYALFNGFGESSLDFELRFWTVSEGWLGVKSDLTIAVHDAIIAAGIEIPFPQRDLHLRSVDPSLESRIHRRGRNAEE